MIKNLIKFPLGNYNRNYLDKWNEDLNDQASYIVDWEESKCHVGRISDLSNFSSTDDFSSIDIFSSTEI